MFDVKAILFDLDGTLVDTVHDIASSMNTLLRDMDRPEFRTEAYRQWIGGGSRAMVARIAQALEIDERLEALLERYMRCYGENLTRLSRPFDGMVDVMQACKACALPMAVLSNKDQWMVEVVCRDLFPGDPFRHTIGLSSAFPAKPDPASARHIASELKVEPRDCLLVGDTAVDIGTAQAAGMRSAAVTWGYGSRQELEDARPDHSFSRSSELEIFIREHSISSNRRISA